jgi:hypothetical protein
MQCCYRTGAAGKSDECWVVTALPWPQLHPCVLNTVKYLRERENHVIASN